MEGHLPLDTSGLNCPLDISNNKLFFSLVDYRNNYFTSNDPNKIIEFYKSFESRDQLIEWMKERPKGVTNIFEVEGSNEIIVVIPTSDFNGKHAKECRENIFKGLHMVFVESGGKEDFYFNYAHNCNMGIKKAMEYNPKWIVVSNDDMYKIDEISKLTENLLNLDESKFDAVFTEPSKYHSIPYMYGEKNYLYKVASTGLSIFNGDIGWNPKIQKQLKKFGVDLLWIKRNLLYKLLIRKRSYFILTSDFAIVSRKYYSETSGVIFDETYINDAEDVELSVKLAQKGRTSTFIDYKIGDYSGSTIGVNTKRYIRTICTRVYLDKRAKEYFI